MIVLHFKVIKKQIKQYYNILSFSLNTELIDFSIIQKSYPIPFNLLLNVYYIHTIQLNSLSVSKSYCYEIFKIRHNFMVLVIIRFVNTSVVVKYLL